MGETLRTPPALGPRMPKNGTLMVDYPELNVAEPLLDTYSPFPTFGSGDPFGLNAFLLHPADPTFDYLLTRPIAGELLPADQHAKVPPGLFNQRLTPSSLQPPGPTAKDTRRRSPLALEVKPGDDEEEQSADSSSMSRLRPMSVGNSLRAMIGRKSAAPEAESPIEEDAAYVRSESVSSALSSSSSTDGSDGLRTPRDSTHNSPDETSAAAAKLAAALAEDDERRPKSVSWRNWLGSKNKRGSFLPFRSDDASPSESGTTLQESPRASAIDLATEAPVPEGISRSAIQLRRVSLNKLGSLRMPSPHPLALVLMRQRANLPDEVAFSIPSSKRVFPMSVNAHQGVGSDLMPAQGGLRLALAVRNVITKLDAGDRPPELSQVKSRQPPRQNAIRPRGVRDFVDRKPFEERMLVYHPDGSCSQISMARSGFAIEDLDFSDHILALMRGQETPSSSSSSLSQRSSLAPTRSQSTNNLSIRSQPQTRMSTVPATGRPVSSFRKPTKPATWDDSSDEEGDVPPSRPVALRSQTAPARAINKNAVNRVSRVMDAQTALEVVTKARERRQDNDSGNVERRQVGADITREQRRKSMMPTSVSTSALVQKDSRPAAQQRASSMAITALKARDQTSRNPRARASSATLATRAREDAHAEAAAKLTGSKTGRSEHRTRSPAPSLPATSRSQGRHSLNPSLRARQSTMAMGMYPMPMAPVPTVAMYGSPMMGQPMMFTPMMPVMTGPMQPNHTAMYHQPQYGSMVPNMPNYRPRPPATGRRRERPVS
ncbi:hypothetical protein A1Q1_06700 [Trichosporon asahii var. asahii CBS 2479]|uniref:Uncharacterized protein n=1 Tax=Trichosporon asahii var. asahii (strain ATCC 90039 / CBS 2479 / JCM 2466 / KCTC 7840 / NBRC 103889/ NCYC 2677 / UAMH 7654) TaxID=1186058 RepID=J4UJT6_TRIAS|nr:hypothetical protein A1Q1_06700 [Trichosporon asahii var. asahii CBS 2479]EJT52070.1 hypothetical protein A1Q1_06700 [Trichosporon asahii var. asahii CBS 2479]